MAFFSLVNVKNGFYCLRNLSTNISSKQFGISLLYFSHVTEDGSNQHNIWTAGNKSVIIQKRGGKSYFSTTLVLAISPDTPFWRSPLQGRSP
jgi:hypothetical protein